MPANTCGDAADNQSIPQFSENNQSRIKHVIGVVSGKGGVGKSMVCGLLATELSRQGKSVGILDADITGPSIPRMFGMANKHASNIGNLLLPCVSKAGVKVMSANLLLPDENEPVLWRGPILAGAIRQFWSDTLWGELDVLLVDMPPGTGDVALTVFQSLPIQGIIVVTSPQDLVRMIVNKAVSMAKKMDVPLLGLVENMAWTTCPCCNEKIEVFGSSHVAEAAAENDLPVLARLGIQQKLTAASDKGELEAVAQDDLLGEAIAKIEALEELEAGADDVQAGMFDAARKAAAEAAERIAQKQASSDK